MAEGANTHRKGLASLAMLTVWKIWQERNGRFFCRKLSPTFVILDRIKCEARSWLIIKMKRLSDLIRESRLIYFGV
jgi:hypothetical protein